MIGVAKLLRGGGGGGGKDPVVAEQMAGNVGLTPVGDTRQINS